MDPKYQELCLKLQLLGFSKERFSGSLSFDYTYKLQLKNHAIRVRIPKTIVIDLKCDVTLWNFKNGSYSSPEKSINTTDEELDRIIEFIDECLKEYE